VGAYFALALGTVSQIHAQSVAGITGVAGFETGLQVIASVRLAHVSKLGDLNPPGAIIRWEITRMITRDYLSVQAARMIHAPFTALTGIHFQAYTPFQSLTAIRLLF